MPSCAPDEDISTTLAHIRLRGGQTINDYERKVLANFAAGRYEHLRPKGQLFEGGMGDTAFGSTPNEYHGPTGPLIDGRCKFTVMRDSGGNSWRIKYLHCQEDKIVTFPVEFRTPEAAIGVARSILLDLPSHYPSCNYRSGMPSVPPPTGASRNVATSA